jgi:carboxypeptidase C (cathepsin A)
MIRGGQAACRAALSGILALTLASAWAQPAGPPGPASQPAGPNVHGSGSQPSVATPATPDSHRLPPDVTTHHVLPLDGRTLRFVSTVGAIRLSDENGSPTAEVGVTAYLLENAPRAGRPVTFVFNGGPGMASAWLQMGALGPWRVNLDNQAGYSSATPTLVPNDETWLDFTDLVFLDPPGTGYARILSGSEDVRRQIWSVTGDVNLLAEAVRQWLDRNGRSVSPKYIAGESYGGFRAPRLARRLQSEEGVGVTGMILLSPLLDAHRESGRYDPFNWVDRLPSYVASARALTGPVTRADLADVEAYAAGDYLIDITRGDADTDAVARVSGRVAALTGLDPAEVQRFHGRVDTDAFQHLLYGNRDLVGSVYDATIARDDPFPRRPLSQSSADAVLDGFKAPITSAMMAVYSDKLNWKPERPYRLANGRAFSQWDWGRGMDRPESVDALRVALSLDPNMRVLVGHGLFDLRTPYFASELILRMVPVLDIRQRIRLQAYPGGHMFYSREESRKAFRADAGWVFEPHTGGP